MEELSSVTDRGKMVKQTLLIKNIPAVLWGEKNSKIMVAVHGNMSNKTDVPIAMLAEEAVPLGYQVLSFDLPQHGDRKKEPTLCKAQNCVHDLSKIMEFAIGYSNDVSLFACSMGAYFSLLAYKNVSLRQILFLSPVVDMGRVIDNMMMWFNVSKERLQAEQEIILPVGQTLYWDYYCYVKENPVACWKRFTAILYGSEDNLSEFEVVSSFANKFDCALEVMSGGEHYFHTPEQLNFFRQWLKKYLK
ncbi:MAG: alpha/beta hydrolase [Firmicutes bacterium]|nr:alpha/beta hydrolase [Bacillota bacterium]